MKRSKSESVVPCALCTTTREKNTSQLTNSYLLSYLKSTLAEGVEVHRQRWIFQSEEDAKVSALSVPGKLFTSGNATKMKGNTVRLLVKVRLRGVEHAEGLQQWRGRMAEVLAAARANKSGTALD